MNGPYDDIIEMPHPTSEKYPRMPAADRAAQFAPFAALTGYGAAVKEAARRTEERREADEERKTQMDLRRRSCWIFCQNSRRSQSPISSQTHERAAALM